MKPEYLDWLKREKTVVTSEGKQVIMGQAFARALLCGF